MSETPAETIRCAATLMRERAGEVTHVFPWRAEGRDVTATQDYDGNDPDWDMGVVLARCTRQDEAEHIAAWHPLVAIEVAGLLERIAADAETALSPRLVCGRCGGYAGNDDCDEDGRCRCWSKAVDVARTYLGDDLGEAGG